MEIRDEHETDKYAAGLIVGAVLSFRVNSLANKRASRQRQQKNPIYVARADVSRGLAGNHARARARAHLEIYALNKFQPFPRNPPRIRRENTGSFFVIGQGADTSIVVDRALSLASTARCLSAPRLTARVRARPLRKHRCKTLDPSACLYRGRAGA
jgi:hypothetical protein